MKNINIYLVLFVVMFSFSSCDDSLLEHNPTDKLAASELLKSESGIKGALNGMYYSLNHRMYQMQIPLINEVRADDILITENSWWYSYVDVYDHATQSINSAARSIWYNGYMAIDAANVIIDDPLLVLSDIDRKDILAQAHAVRAMVYLDMIGIYAKPVYDNSSSPGLLLITTSEHGKSNPRVSVELIYDQIKKDLDFALANIQNDSDPTRMNKALINGLLARYYLDYRDYETAYTYASAVVDAVPLMEREELRYGLSMEPSEAVFTMYTTSKDYGLYYTFCSLWNGGDHSRQGARVYPEMFSRFAENDVRRTFFWDFDNWSQWPGWFGDPISSSLYDGGWTNYHFMYGKFPRKDFECTDIKAYLETGDSKYVKNNGTLSLGNYTYMRASEMVLIKAECSARNGDFATAQDELFKIQSRALVDTNNPDDDSQTAAVKSTKTGADLIAEIMMEKRKELLGEGHRMRDLLRLGEDFTRPASAWTQVKNVSINSNYVILPIADTEININDELDLTDQNPGYK